MLREVADVLFHLLRSRRAVQPEDVDGKWLKDRHHSGDVGPHQHRAGGLHGHRHHQGTTFTGGFEGLLDSLQCRLDLENVLTGLDDEQIDIAGDQALRLFPEGRAHRVEIDVAEGGQFGGGSHGTGHEAWFLGGAVLIRHLPGEFRRLLVQGMGVILQAVFGQNDRGGTEGVGLDHIASRLQKLAMHRLNGIGPGDHQVLVATLQFQTAEVISRQIHLLQAGSGGPVEDEHGTSWTVQVAEKTGIRHGCGGHRRCHGTLPVVADSKKSPWRASLELRC